VRDCDHGAVICRVKFNKLARNFAFVLFLTVGRLRLRPAGERDLSVDHILGPANPSDSVKTQYIIHFIVLIYHVVAIVPGLY